MRKIKYTDCPCCGGEGVHDCNAEAMQCGDCDGSGKVKI